MDPTYLYEVATKTREKIRSSHYDCQSCPFKTLSIGDIEAILLAAHEIVHGGHE